MKQTPMQTYFRQKREMGLPADILWDSSGVASPGKSTPPPENTGADENTPHSRSYEEKRAALTQLFRETANCRKCILGTTRHKAVFGAGTVNARVFVVGEAPGFNEDQTGLPFVGKAGELLTKMLGAIDLDRSRDVFVSNIVKCRPPENRNPAPDECLSCIPILEKQIEIIQPASLLILGRVAASNLLREDRSISSIKSEVFNYRGIPAMVTYHPAALLRNPALKRTSWETLKLFSTLAGTV
jgi:DNA polymerase